MNVFAMETITQTVNAQVILLSIISDNSHKLKIILQGHATIINI